MTTKYLTYCSYNDNIRTIKFAKLKFSLTCPINDTANSKQIIDYLFYSCSTYLNNKKLINSNIYLSPSMHVCMHKYVCMHNHMYVRTWIYYIFSM